MRLLAAFLILANPLLSQAQIRPLPAQCTLGLLFDHSRCANKQMIPICLPDQDPNSPICKMDAEFLGRAWAPLIPEKPAGTKISVKPENQKEKNEIKTGKGFWETLGNSFLGIFNALFNLIKLAVFAPLSIVSNILEGVVDGIGDIFRGDLWGAITWPVKTALNAAWNTVMTGFVAANVITDPLWRLIKPDQAKAYGGGAIPEDDISIDLAGAGPRLRVQATGGPLAWLHAISQDATAYVSSSAFIHSHQRELSRETLAHEIGHTFQTQDSFLIDLVGRRILEGPEHSSKYLENGNLIRNNIDGKSFDFQTLASAIEIPPEETPAWKEHHNLLKKYGDKGRYWISGSVESEADFIGEGIKSSVWGPGIAAPAPAAGKPETKTETSKENSSTNENNFDAYLEFLGEFLKPHPPSQPGHF